MSEQIEPGDIVHHAPSGEDWVVLRVTGEHLEPAGWPPCQAVLADCALIRKGTPDERKGMLNHAARNPKA